MCWHIVSDVHYIRSITDVGLLVVMMGAIIVDHLHHHQRQQPEQQCVGFIINIIISIIIISVNSIHAAVFVCACSPNIRSFISAPHV